MRIRYTGMSEEPGIVGCGLRKTGWAPGSFGEKVPTQAREVMWLGQDHTGSSWQKTRTEQQKLSLSSRRYQGKPPPRPVMQ